MSVYEYLFIHLKSWSLLINFQKISCDNEDLKTEKTNGKNNNLYSYYSLLATMDNLQLTNKMSCIRVEVLLSGSKNILCF